MKKLIFSLIVGVAMVVGTSVETKASCNGTFLYLCESQLAKFKLDFESNCQVHDVVEWELIEDCLD